MYEQGSSSSSKNHKLDDEPSSALELPLELASSLSLLPLSDVFAWPVALLLEDEEALWALIELLPDEEALWALLLWFPNVWFRGPQSTQSVPKSQKEYSEPSPPSSQVPSWA